MIGILKRLALLPGVPLALLYGCCYWVVTGKPVDPLMDRLLRWGGVL